MRIGEFAGVDGESAALLFRRAGEGFRLAPLELDIEPGALGNELDLGQMELDLDYNGKLPMEQW